ncbi:MAG: hypothetical protein RIM99_16165 [Cyclobacteriaceae bacterium]
MLTPDLVKNAVLVSWYQLHGRKCLLFDFHGTFSEDEATAAIKRWKEEASGLKPGEKTDLIWNCIEMKKYTGGAARLWKNAMAQFKDSTEFVWLVSSNPFIRMGAKTVTFLLPLKLKAVNSIDEIPAR